MIFLLVDKLLDHLFLVLDSGDRTDTRHKNDRSGMMTRLESSLADKETASHRRFQEDSNDPEHSRQPTKRIHQ